LRSIIVPRGHTCQGLPHPGQSIFKRYLDTFSIVLTTLKGPTLDWYYSLPRHLIGSFETLWVRLTARFADYIPIVIDSTSLKSVIQGDVKPHKYI